MWLPTSQPLPVFIAVDHLDLPQARIGRLPARIVLSPGKRHHTGAAPAAAGGGWAHVQ